MGFWENKYLGFCGQADRFSDHSGAAVLDSTQGTWQGGYKRSWNQEAIGKLSNLGRGEGEVFEFNLNCWQPNGEYLVGLYCYPGF